MPKLSEIAAASQPPGSPLTFVSLFASATETEVDCALSVQTVILSIRNGQWASEVAEIRTAIQNGNREKADHLKRRLPAFTASAVLRSRARSCEFRLVRHSGWLQADFDAKDNPGMVQSAARQSLQQDAHCGAVFVGPSGSGIKALVRIDPARHRESVVAAIAHFRDAHGMAMDEKCREIERLCFVSHDPQAWLRDGETAELPLPAAVPAASSEREAPPLPEEQRQWNVRDVEELLSYLPKMRPDYEVWLRVVSGVASVLPMADAIRCLQQWMPEDKPGEYETKWRHRLRQVSIRTVIRMAQAHGFDAAAAARRQRWLGRLQIGGREFGSGPDNSDLLEADPELDQAIETWQCLTDEQHGDATLFQRKLRHEWLHDALAVKWRHYNAATGLWEIDLTGSALLAGRDTILESYSNLEDTIRSRIADSTDKAEIKAGLADLATVRSRKSCLGRASWCNGVMDFAKRMPEISCEATQFDRARHFLAVRNGVIDFKGGRRLEFSPAHRLSSGAPVDWIPGAACPEFSAFLLARMGGDREMVAYLWRLIGYSLTGFVDHDALFICYGTGSNGKSTLFKVLETLLGPQLAVNMDITLLVGGSGESGSTVDYKLSTLEGKRLVLASEPAEERALNEATVKKLLGGEPIQARRLYEMPYSFAPTHKIWVGTNHKPNIKGTDYGIWRRIHLIPWEHMIPLEEQRPREEVVATFCAELSGILNAAIAGYSDFLARGGRLDPPASVLAATNEYRQDEDSFGIYLRENLETAPAGAVRLTVLLEHYLRHCESSRERAIATNPRKFSSKLKERRMVVETFGSGGFAHLLGYRLTGSPVPKIVTSQPELSDRWN